MKFAIILGALCVGLLLGGCESQSLISDEEYYKSRGPAAHSPDPTAYLPSAQQNPNYSR